jgi:hypothetical protein
LGDNISLVITSFFLLPSLESWNTILIKFTIIKNSQPLGLRSSSIFLLGSSVDLAWPLTFLFAETFGLLFRILSNRFIVILFIILIGCLFYLYFGDKGSQFSDMIRFPSKIFQSIDQIIWVSLEKKSIKISQYNLKFFSKVCLEDPNALFSDVIFKSWDTIHELIVFAFHMCGII